MAAPVLELEHHRRDGLGRVSARPMHFAAARPDCLADVVVLAEDAAQVAVPEEDGAGAPPTAEAVFFAEMGEVGGDDGVPAGLAGGPLVLQPVDPAVAGAGPALGQTRDS